MSSNLAHKGAENMKFNSREINRLLIVLVTVSSLILVPFATGCDEEDIPTDLTHEYDDEPVIQTNDEDELTLRVKLFFGDKEAMEENEPGEYGYVAPVFRSIEFTCEKEEAMETTLNELIQGPNSDEEDFIKTVDKETELISVEIDKNEELATVDFSEEVINNPPSDNSPAGTTFQESMVFTITQFPSVDKVQVNVEGSPWAYDGSIWDSPMSRESFGY